MASINRFLLQLYATNQIAAVGWQVRWQVFLHSKLGIQVTWLKWLWTRMHENLARLIRPHIADCSLISITVRKSILAHSDHSNYRSFPLREFQCWLDIACLEGVAQNRSAEQVTNTLLIYFRNWYSCAQTFSMTYREQWLALPSLTWK